MLELWVDIVPENPDKCDTTSCGDFLDLIESNVVILCTERNGNEWNKIQDEWRDFFDDMLGIGKFERCRIFWMMPRRKSKSGGEYDATTFLNKPPDELLRLALARKDESIITTAEEFKLQFSMLTSGTHHVEVYDRYLLSIQRELMRFDKEDIVYMSEFKHTLFSRQINSINLILHALPPDVREISIYSDMLDWRTFRNEALLKGVTVKKEDYYDWAAGSYKAKNKAIMCIAEQLKRISNPIDITFFDCFGPETLFTDMEHDRYVKISQNRSFISSSGFNIVWHDIGGKNMDEILLQPKTFMIQVPSSASAQPNLRIIHKTTVSA